MDSDSIIVSVMANLTLVLTVADMGSGNDWELWTPILFIFIGRIQ